MNLVEVFNSFWVGHGGPCDAENIGKVPIIIGG